MDNERLPAPSEAAAGAAALRNRVVAERYELLEAIGEGPLLQAFRARDRALNRIVAVKTLLPGPAETAGIVERLRTGLSQVLSLSHAGIARAYDVGEDDETALFLAEEYVRGIDLKERIRRVAPFSLTASTDVAIALSEALEFAHARGVTHGDVRSQNVLIGPEGQIKVTGFGVAPAAWLLASTDPAVSARLTPYAAPRMTGPSAAGDLYALGVVLFEMLTGNLPLRGGQSGDDLTPTPRTINPGVPRALEGIVQKAMRAQVGERYASASQMLQDLRAVRDALRHGKSLSWSPLDRAAAGEDVAPLDHATVPMTTGDRTLIAPLPAPAAFSPTDATAVMPPLPARRTPQPAATAFEPEDHDAMPTPPAAYRGSRWLTTLNLFLLALVLAALGTLGWLTFTFVRPLNEVIVPNLVGRSLDEAQALARERKFALVKVDEQFRDPDKEPNGVIYQMRPEPGRVIRENKSVSIWVSKGPRLVEVPDVRDVSFDKARRDIEKAGLRIGAITFEFDSVAAKGNVIRQEPGAAENEPRGTKIDLVISKGEEPPPPPIEEPAEVPLPLPAEGGEPGGEGEGAIRTFVIRYPKNGVLSQDNSPHRIRIDVSDRDGLRTVYDEVREAGERVEEDVQGTGKNVIIRLYDNDELRYDSSDPKGGT